MKDFFRKIQWWRSEVEIRTGRRSKMAEKNLGWRRRAAGMSHWCQASAVRGCVPILINPEFDAALDRDSCVTHWMSSPGSALWYTDIWQSFFLSFRECCLTRQWQSTECDTRYMVQRKKFDVILRFLVDRYRQTKPPKPDASQFVVPARLSKPVIGSGGLSSSQFDDDVSEVNCTWTASFSWRVKEAALWFESYGSKNLTGGTTWSPPQPIDWREHTIGAVHDRNLPTRSLQVPESYENFLWHRVKVRSSVTGLRHDDERDDDRSHCRVSIMSSLDVGWFRLITNILIQSRDLAMIARWHQCGTMTSQMLARASFSAVCLTVFPFEFRPRTFTIGFYGKKLYHIRAYDFGVQFSFKSHTITRCTWRQ